MLIDPLLDATISSVPLGEIIQLALGTASQLGGMAPARAGAGRQADPLRRALHPAPGARLAAGTRSLPDHQPGGEGRADRIRGSGGNDATTADDRSGAACSPRRPRLSLVAALWTAQPARERRGHLHAGQRRWPRRRPSASTSSTTTPTSVWPPRVSNASFASTSAKATATPFAFGLANLVAAITCAVSTRSRPASMPTALTANSDEGNGQPVERTPATTKGSPWAPRTCGPLPVPMPRPTRVAFGIDLAGIAAVSGGESHARATSDAATRTRRVTADTRGRPVPARRV